MKLKLTKSGLIVTCEPTRYTAAFSVAFCWSRRGRFNPGYLWSIGSTGRRNWSCGYHFVFPIDGDRFMQISANTPYRNDAGEVMVSFERETVK